MGHDWKQAPTIDDRDLVPWPVFWLYVSVASLVVAMASLAGLAAVGRRLGFSVGEFGRKLTLCVSFLLAYDLVDRTLRWFGASRSGKGWEHCGRTRLGAEPGEAGVVELVYQR